MKFMKFAPLFIFLSACATFGQMEKGLDALMGKSEQTSFSVLGYPSSKQEFGGDVVYTWFLNQSGTVFVPQTSTTTGYVGRTPIYGTTTYTQAMPVNYSCVIKIIARTDGTLKTWEYNGNIGGCTPYINRLNEYAKTEQNFVPGSTGGTMTCEADSDCATGYSCRSRKGGGTECRVNSNSDFSLPNGSSSSK